MRSWSGVRPLGRWDQMADKPNDPVRDRGQTGKPGDSSDPRDPEDEALNLGRRRSAGTGSFGGTIGGIMHGIDADIFRDPAAIQRMQRDSKAVLRASDGTVIGIELPGEGILTDDPPEDAA